MTNSYLRIINFEGVSNFRDLGGYRTSDGRTTVWRTLFRSGELQKITKSGLENLTGELKVNTVIDLRSSIELGERGIGLLSETNIKYHNISFISDAVQSTPRKANE